MKMVTFGIPQKDSGCEQTQRELRHRESREWQCELKETELNLVLITGVAPAQWHRIIPTHFQQPKTQTT